MLEELARGLLFGLALYLVPGIAFGVTFVLRGLERIDPQAEDGSWGFRLAILPASVVFWPLLLRRWIGGKTPPEERNAHREQAVRGGGE